MDRRGMISCSAVARAARFSLSSFTPSCRHLPVRDRSRQNRLRHLLLLVRHPHPYETGYYHFWVPFLACIFRLVKLMVSVYIRLYRYCSRRPQAVFVVCRWALAVIARCWKFLLMSLYILVIMDALYTRLPFWKWERRSIDADQSA